MIQVKNPILKNKKTRPKTSKSSVETGLPNSRNIFEKLTQEFGNSSGIGNGLPHTPKPPDKNSTMVALEVFFNRSILLP